MLSVRALLVFLVLCIAVPFAGASIWSIAAAYRREQASTSQTLQEATRALSLAVGRQLGTAEAVARTLAASPDLSEGRLEAFYEQARNVTTPGGGWAVLLDADRMLVNTSLPFGSPLPPKRKPVGSRLTNVREDQADVSPLFDGPLTGHRAIAVTVTNKQMGRSYDISVVLSPARIQEVLADQRLPLGWIATVVDQKGVVVARMPDGEKWTGRALSAKVVDIVKEKHEGIFQTTSLEGISATAFFHQVPGSMWTLAIAVPDNVLSQSAMTPIVRNAAIAACMLAVAIGLALWMARKLLAPALAIQRVAQDLENRRPVSYASKGVREFDVAGAAMVTAAQRLANANTDLEQRIDEALEAARNTHLKVEAAQRQEALKKLTGGVAHDVNNLLATISTSAALLERRPDDPQRAKRIEAIKRAVGTGRDLTQKLMSFSRQKAHDTSLIDLRTWLPDRIALLKEKTAPQIIFQISIDSGVALIKVDAAELQVAIVNLASNSAQAMGGAGIISITVQSGAGEGAGKVNITVDDEGPGVAVELYSRIFEPFFTTGEAGSRTGLGLAQVLSFCELSGGSIQVGRGAVGAKFTMSLPVADPSAERSANVSRERIGTPVTAKLLYVEDNIDVGEPTREVLESMGYHVRWELSAEAGLKAASAADYDIVLSDFSLPGTLSGLDLGLQLRTERPKLPFLLLTGYAHEGTKAANEGFPVLYKPCPLDQLEAALLGMRKGTVLV